MSKGQRNNSRQPLARVRGQESGQSRNPQPPRGPRGLSSLNAPATPRAKPAANVGRSAPHADSRGPAAPAPKRRSADGATAPAPVQHERRFGNKNAAMPAPAGEQPAGEFGKARREHTGGKVQRAKKLALRAPNQKVVDRSQRLRETRVDMDDIEPVRLQKALAASGVGSRREMEEWIEAGFVTVNGKKASLGDKVGPRDRVMVKGDNIKLKWADRLPRVIMYHKQEGEIVTRDDPERRVTVFDRLPQAKSSRWVAIGRLDVNTSGLLLITTSGELANRMMHPSFEFDREYSVRVLGELTREQMNEMTRGVELEDGPAVFQRVSEKGGAEDGANRWYNVVIREGRNREVRRMFEHFGLTVSRLIRVRFGNIGLPPRLKRGQYYELNESEVAAVMKWAGLTATGQEAPARGGKRAPR